MSFVDLMGNDVWSAADIVRRTEAELHGHVSKETELILSRKMIGYSLGLLIPTATEAGDLTMYETAAYLAQESGLAATADMVRLHSVFAHEAAQRRLALDPVVEPEMIELVDDAGELLTVVNPALTIDISERNTAQALLDAASTDTLSLVTLRNPPKTTESEVTSA